MPDLSQWQRKDTSLKFVLGELCLFEVATPAFSHLRHFSLRSPDIDLEEIKTLLQDAPLVACTSWPVAGPIARMTWMPGMIRYVPSQYKRFYVRLSGDFQAYMKLQFGSKSRANLLKKVRRFEEFCKGEKYFGEYRAPDEMGSFYDLARQVSRLTYQERLLRVGLPDSDDFREELIKSAGAGTVRGYLLMHGARPVAYASCSIRDARLIYGNVGYDPEYKQWSPGTVLIFKILESVFRDPSVEQFDFGGGDADYKSFFSTDNIDCATIYFFRRTLRNTVVVVSHLGMERVSTALVRLVDRLHVKKAIKRFLRLLGTKTTQSAPVSEDTPSVQS